MKKAILEITPDHPEKYFDLETNGLNKVQIMIGLKACLIALQDEVRQQAIESVGSNPTDIQKWVDSQAPEWLKVKMKSSTNSIWN